MAALTVPVEIDRSSPVPLYHQLAEQLGQAIADGRLKPGDPFENEMSVAERLQLSRPTVRRAIQELVDQGLLVRRRGLGTTVANRKVHRKFQLSSLYDELVRDGRKPTTVVLDLAEQTQRARGRRSGPARRTRRCCTSPGSGSPTASRSPSCRTGCRRHTRDLTREELERDGLYATLRTRGARPVVAQQFIGARMPTTTERNRLDMPRSQPVLTMMRTAFDASGQAIEFGDHCYRASDYTIDLMVDER